MESKILKAFNIKKTVARLEILKLLRITNHNLSVEEVLEKLENIDLSTVYRTLNLFEEKQIVVKTYDENLKAYVYKYVKDKHFHKLKCLKCQKVIQTNFCPMDSFLANAYDESQFYITDYIFEIFGYCIECYEMRFDKDISKSF